MTKNILIVILIAAAGILVLLSSFSTYLAARNIIRPPIGSTIDVVAVAYAPSPYQTDASPCTTASGTRVRRGIIATNFLPMGTVVQANEEFYIVEDRMHPRYNRVIDIFMPSSSEARQFGRKDLSIEIIAYGEPGQDLPPIGNVPIQEPPPITDDPPGIIDRWQGNLNYFVRLLKAGTPNDVNQYDVNCFDE